MRFSWNLLFICLCSGSATAQEQVGQWSVLRFDGKEQLDLKLAELMQDSQYWEPNGGLRFRFDKETANAEHLQCIAVSDESGPTFQLAKRKQDEPVFADSNAKLISKIVRTRTEEQIELLREASIDLSHEQVSKLYTAAGVDAAKFIRRCKQHTRIASRQSLFALVADLSQEWRTLTRTKDSLAKTVLNGLISEKQQAELQRHAVNKLCSRLQFMQEAPHEQQLLVLRHYFLIPVSSELGRFEKLSIEQQKALASLLSEVHSARVDTTPTNWLNASYVRGLVRELGDREFMDAVSKPQMHFLRAISQVRRR